MKRIFIVAILGLTTAGCDIMYGVKRSAPIAEEPEISCIEAVIRSAPGVSSVFHEKSQDRAVTNNFFYKGSNSIRAVLQYTKDHHGKLILLQSIFGINETPPQEQVTASRPVMLYIERELESRCGLVNLSAKVTEWCRGVSCPALE